MNHYADEFKAAIVEKLLPPHNVSVPQMAQETGIPQDTLYTWGAKYRKSSGVAVPAPDQPPERWSAEDTFAVGLETATLSEADLSACCRRQGLSPEQIEAWPRGQWPSRGGSARSQAKRIKALQAELRRKGAGRGGSPPEAGKSRRSGGRPRTIPRPPRAPTRYGPDHTSLCRRCSTPGGLPGRGLSVGGLSSAGSKTGRSR
jgi:transposase-like protein